MVCQWGMSDRIGPLTFGRGEEHVFLGKRLAQEKTYSEEMGWIIDQEIESIVRGAERRSLELLQENRARLDRLAAALLEREELLGADLDAILWPEGRPSGSDAERGPR
jgi:cell division protease FtsH